MKRQRVTTVPKQCSVRGSSRAFNYAQGKMDSETSFVVTTKFVSLSVLPCAYHYFYYYWYFSSFLSASMCSDKTLDGDNEPQTLFSGFSTRSNPAACCFSFFFLFFFFIRKYIPASPSPPFADVVSLSNSLPLQLYQNWVQSSFLTSVCVLTAYRTSFQLHSVDRLRIEDKMLQGTIWFRGRRSDALPRIPISLECVMSDEKGNSKAIPFEVDQNILTRKGFYPLNFIELHQRNIRNVFPLKEKHIYKMVIGVKKWNLALVTLIIGRWLLLRQFNLEIVIFHIAEFIFAPLCMKD